MNERYRRELERLLGAGPPPAVRAWRACFYPSFSVECVIEVEDGGSLRIASPQRQIHAWLQQAGESPASAWVEPAVADERIEIPQLELGLLVDRFANLALGPWSPRGMIIDGMPVTLLSVSGSGASEVEGEVSILPEDWQTFAHVLVDFARERARWMASQTALEGVRRCLPTRRTSSDLTRRSTP